MLLTNLQEEKIQEIVSYFNSGNPKVDFKAPTGSGKTLMATGVISKMINTNPDKKMVFIIATLSSIDLPEQFERKINEYKGDLEFNDFEVEYIQSPSTGNKTPKDMQIQIRPEQNKVYIFGKATFGRGRIITEQKIIDSFVHECKQQGYTICYIRDEAHIGTRLRPNDTASFEQLMAKYADYILQMTATLDLKDTTTQKVVLTENDLCNPEKNDGKWLIKTKPERLYNDTLNDDVLLDDAIQKFKVIKKEYNILNCLIKPAMLIQVDNEPTDETAKQDFKDTLIMIKQKLSEAGLSWVQYFGNSDKEASNVDNSNFTLDKITRNDDTTDCIIFKIGPATGWDIPRACMLLQLRNVCSTNLNIQTIGRIKRNPYPNLKRVDTTDKYYLYSNAPAEKNDNLSFHEYTVKDRFKNEEFASIVIKKDKELFDSSKAKTEVGNFFNKKNNDIRFRINNSFGKNGFENEEKRLVITSPIMLLKMLKVFDDNLTKYQKKVISEIEKAHKASVLKDVKIQTLKLILFNYFMKDINNIAQKSIESNVQYELKTHVVDPKIYTEITSGTNTNQRNATENYLFDFKKNGKSEKIQHLSSNNENVVFDAICGYIDYNDNLKVWAKNQETGNIYGEYFDENKFIKHSFFDFILKFNNGNLLYIEVKGDGENDINRDKTELLRTAYRDYFQKKEKDLFHQKIVVCLARVNNATIIPELFYDANLFQFDENISFPRMLRILGEDKSS